MKLKNYKNFRYNLINSEFIKIKFYLGVTKLFFLFFNNRYILGFRNRYSVFEMLYIKAFLKKSLKLIYKYHINHKKILFIGFKDVNKWTKFKLLFLKSKHFIVSNFWIRGFLMNRSAIFATSKKIFKKKYKKHYFLEMCFVDKTPDIAVFLSNSSFKIPYQEIKNYKIPFVLLSNNYSKNVCLNYKVFGNFVSYKSQIFLYLLLKSILTFSKIDVKKKRI